MKFYRVTEDDRLVWVAVLAHENMYGYVANTGRFHDNNALRNDFYMDRHFSYEEIGIAEARRLIETEVESLDKEEYAEVLVEWRGDLKSLDPTETLSMAAGHNP